MGIFSRFRDIVNSNINAMLDRAEDPEKLIRLMIQEMEDTLVDIKASCARTMASHTRVNRALLEARDRSNGWNDKARLAVEKGREDLAREALRERRIYQDQISRLEREADQFAGMIDQFRADIEQLEGKLETTRKKHRLLVQRHLRARKHHAAQSKLREADASDALIRFDEFENRIERMEAAADLVNVPAKPDLEEKFRNIENDKEIENELQQLKQAVAGTTQPAKGSPGS